MTAKTDVKPPAPLMLGVSGMRGITGQSLTPEVALRYAAAFGTFLHRRTASPIVLIGRDGRRGGEAVYEAAVSGLLGAGCCVTRLGVVSTPTVGHAAMGEADGAVIITASHNPQEWNGLKFLLGGAAGNEDTEFDFACAPPIDLAKQIIEQYHDGPEWNDPVADRPLVDESEAAYGHWVEVAGRVITMLPDSATESWSNHGSIGLRCVLDAVNSSGSTVGVPFLDYLAEVITLNCSSSGVFPHTPEPTRENLSGSGGLCSVVPGVSADVGFAQDPDADRLAIIDETGRYIGEEYTLVLSALALLELEDDPTDTVLVANLSTSRMIDDLAERFGARVERTPVGEAHVAQRMIELLADGQNVVLGGEGNGGVIWPEISFVRDSVVAIGLTLALISRHGKPLSAIVDGLPGYSIVKRKQDIPSKDAAKPAIDAVAEAFKDRGRVDLQDGVRIDLDDQKAWLSLRASNTEPIVRLIAEAPDEAAANALLDEVQALLD
ncbi:MAG: phosphoglucosamine mutase [Phycisphaerales bacterium]